MSLAYVYKIINQFNNKIYIGSTVRPHERKLEHFRHADKKSLIGTEIQKFGRENFIFEVIEITTNEQRYEREKFYIESLNTIYPNGYNLHNNSDIIFKDNKHVKRKPSQICLEKAWATNSGKKRSNYTKQLLSEAKKGKPCYHRRKKIIALVNGEEIIFDSITQASEMLKIKRRSISNVLNGWSKKAYGIEFKFFGDKK